MTGINATARGGVVTGSLAASGAGDWFCPDEGLFNIDVSGAWTGSWKLQRSFDDGATASDYTLLDQPFAPTTNASTELEQVEGKVLWRVSFTRTSGALSYRLSQ